MYTDIPMTAHGSFDCTRQVQNNHKKTAAAVFLRVLYDICKSSEKY